MCRLFFSFRNKYVKPLLKEFLEQSHHDHKNTPDIDNYRDFDKHENGFGIAWLPYKNEAWNIYKQPMSYKNDPNVDSVLDMIPNNLILGHIRRKTIGEEVYENTHPFYYRDKVFMQNGSISDFSKHKKVVYSYISSPLVKEIIGETDTECLFYLFLSCVKYIEKRHQYSHYISKKNSTRKKTAKQPEFTRKQIALYEIVIENTRFIHNNDASSMYINAFRMLVTIFRLHEMEVGCNVIYANDEFVIITRYLQYDKSKYDNPQLSESLYWNKCRKNGDTGLLITSEPITGYDSVLIPESTIIVVNYKKYDMIIHNIL